VCCQRFDAVCALEVLADAAKTNVKVLIALQDIARGSQCYYSSSHDTSTHEGIKIPRICAVFVILKY